MAVPPSPNRRTTQAALIPREGKRRAPGRSPAISTQRLRFLSIRLENWRNFRSVAVALQGRVFIAGPNAAGKSNLLDALRFLRDLAHAGLQQAIGISGKPGKRGGVSNLRSLHARKYPDVVVAVGVGTGDAQETWEYEIHINQDSQRTPIVKKEVVRHGGRVLLNRESETEADPELLTQTHLEQVTLNRDFRPLAHFFQSIRYMHIVPQLVRDPQRSIGYKDDPYGSDLLEQIASTQAHTQSARLRRIREALQIAVPQLDELELTRDSKGAPHLRGKYAHWRQQGAWQTEEQLSDGTLRLLGLLWAVQDGSGPLLLEEPELSLHPEVVRFIPQMFARLQHETGRQVIVSTHSADMLSDSGIGLDETLLLTPTTEGTEIVLASNIDEAAELLQHGSTLAEIAFAHTRPANASQLTLSQFW